MSNLTNGITERLTEWLDSGQAIPRMDLRKNGHQKCTNKLAEYEDLEEQGLLLKLPCKVGDTVYNLVPMVSQESSFREDIVKRIVISEDGVVIFFANGTGENIESFGKTVFLTKEEAEKALEEMEK